MLFFYPAVHRLIAEKTGDNWRNERVPFRVCKYVWIVNCIVNCTMGFCTGKHMKEGNRLFMVEADEKFVNSLRWVWRI